MFGPSLRPGQSHSSHNFSQVPKVGLSRTAFDRTSRLTTTGNVDYLLPVFCDEVLPGDTFNMSMSAIARLTTLAVPFMDNLYLDSFFFFVPNRLIWDNWQKFMGERVDPDDSIDFIIPQIVSPASVGFANESLFDYLGWPTQVADFSASTLPNRAYNLVYNEWFRDQNLQDSVVVDRDDGPDSPADYVLLRRGKRHDYFTSCLPWPQKGDDVLLPLGDSAPVTGIGVLNTFGAGGAKSNLYETGTGTTLINYPMGSAFDTSNVFLKQTTGGVPQVFADLSDATASSINTIREAVTVQQFLEQDARGGTRYTEIIRSHFNVVSPDARLQRPEYLGGGSSMVNVSPIAQTSNDGTNGDVGNLAAIGTLAANGRREGHGFVKSFVEHGYILGLVNVRADLTYQQGCPRHFSRRTRYDFFWPTFQNLGEQAVLNKEIFANGDANDDLVFGYQERYAEYRYAPNRISGKIRSNDAQSLDVWTLSQDFASLPLLNSEFIESDTPIDRVTVVSTEPNFRFDFLFNLNCVRPMSMFSVPGLTRF